MNYKLLKEFYKNFFNYNYCRDLRVIYPPILYKVNNIIKQPKPDLLHSFSYSKDTTDLDMYKTFYKFLFRKKHRDGSGNCYYEMTNYNYLKNYRDKSNSQPYVDRLFFDFDLEEEPQINKAKEELKTVRTTLTGKEKIKAEKKVKQQFKELLLTTSVLKTPFEEAMKLNNHLKNEENLKTLLLFSGSKGFALNIFFKPIPIKNISEISYTIAQTFKKELKLTTLDLAVNKDALVRLQRVPYTKHNNTLLFNQTIPQDINFYEFLTIIQNKKPKIIDLNIKEYHENNIHLSNTLLEYNNSFTKLNKQRKKITNNYYSKNKYKNNNNKFLTGDDKKDIFADCRILAKYLLGKPSKEYKNYNTYLCPFHDDNIASARVYKNNFICAGCGTYYRYFDFIKAVKELELGHTLNKNDVKKEMKKIKLNLK